MLVDETLFIPVQVDRTADDIDAEDERLAEASVAAELADETWSDDGGAGDEPSALESFATTEHVTDAEEADDHASQYRS